MVAKIVHGISWSRLRKGAGTEGFRRTSEARFWLTKDTLMSHEEPIDNAENQEASNSE